MSIDGVIFSFLPFSSTKTQNDYFKSTTSAEREWLLLCHYTALGRVATTPIRQYYQLLLHLIWLNGWSNVGFLSGSKEPIDKQITGLVALALQILLKLRASMTSLSTTLIPLHIKTISILLYTHGVVKHLPFKGFKERYSPLDLWMTILSPMPGNLPTFFIIII